MIEEGLIIATTAGCVEAFKVSFNIRKRYYPLISLFFGLFLSFILNGLNGQAVFYGFIYGLSASGLYSQTKTLFKRGD
jgi:hypothetical protein